MQVKFEDVTMAFEDNTVLDKINFEIPENELVTVLGPSGCGKSTTLMLISGLVFPNSGKIYFGDKEVTDMDAVDRKVGMVFQNYALYPHLTVLENIQFPLKMQKVKKEEQVERAMEMARLVKIEDHIHKKPAELSGGQQQRVAIARSLVKRPSLLLMDEPLSNLDARLRIEMREEIRRIQQETGVTTVFVTHDQEEALSISDKIMVLNAGYIQQYSSPTELYNEPENLFVAKFLGTPIINSFSVDEAMNLPKLNIPETAVNEAKTVAIRPESLYEVDNKEDALIRGTVRFVSEKEKEDGPVILIDNGDFIQGSPLTQYIEENEKSPETLISVLNELEHDVGIIGNHEFNYGLDYLKKGIEAANYPVLSANILEKGDYLADGPVFYLEKSGVKIGILGLTTQYIPHWEHPENIENLKFFSAVETAKEWVPKIREKADLVIVAYHGGMESNFISGRPTETHTGENEGYKLLTEVTGIDVLITGHQHREIAEIVNGISLIQPGQRGEHLGKIVLEIGTENKISKSEVELLSVDEVQVDTNLCSKYKPIQRAVNNWLDEVIGQTNGDVTIDNPHQVRLVEHPYVEFINRVQLHYGKADISLTALFSNHVTGYSKEITIRDVLTNYPYPNTLAVIKVTGAELRQALEQTAEYFIVNDKNQIAVNPKFLKIKPQPYNYDMYEGIEYIIDVGKEVGNRIVHLQYQGRDIQPTDEFELVTNQYRAVGGGNYTMFEGKEFIREITIPMNELISAYIRENKMIQSSVNHNFKVINSIGS